MTFKAIDWAFNIDDLHPVEKLVLVYLGKCANSKDECFPSIRDIAEKCNIARSSVYVALKEFKQRGILTIVQQEHKKSGRQKPSLYKLKLHRGGSSHKTIVSSHETLSSGDWTPMIESSSNPHLNPQETDSKTNPFEKFGENSEQISEGKLGTVLSYPEIFVSPPEFVFALSAEGGYLLSVEEAAYNLHQLKTSPTLGDQLKASSVVDLHTQPVPIPELLAQAKKHGIYSNSSLQILWAKVVGRTYPDMYVGQPSKKWSSKLTNLRKLVEPVVDIGVLLVHIIRFWGQFGKWLKEQGIVQDFPDLPHLGFLLKHGEMALQFFKTQTSDTTVDKPSGLKMFDPADF